MARAGGLDTSGEGEAVLDKGFWLQLTSTLNRFVGLQEIMFSALEPTSRR